jgi:NADH dehydrogenase
VDNVATGTLPGLAELGITPAALEAVMPMLLARRDSVARLDVWRRTAGR